MARKPRIEFAGAFYHIITRGNQRQMVFKEVTDFQKYLQLLALYKKRYNYCLYAYVLMGNHIHLLIETRQTPLSKILQGINQSYTMYFNKKYHTVGHLFQGRYKAILCDRDAYLLTLIKYIHNNPVRARIIENIGLYKWSSHHAYGHNDSPNELVDVNLVLKMISENRVLAYKRYMDFMKDENTATQNEIYATVDQRLQGDEEFIDRVMSRYDGEIMKGRRKKEYTLPAISKAVATRLGLSIEHLKSHNKIKHALLGRKLFSCVAEEYGYKKKEIAKFLLRDPAAVTGYIKDKDYIRQDIETIIKMLKYGYDI